MLLESSFDNILFFLYDVLNMHAFGGVSMSQWPSAEDILTAHVAEGLQTLPLKALLDIHPSKQHIGNKVGGLLQALLDDDQLLQIYPKLLLLTYEDGFEVVGEECGLSPPLMLCKPCKQLMQNPPPTCEYEQYQHDIKQPILNPRFWFPFHTSISELIACCHSSEGVCHLCHLFWDCFCAVTNKKNSNEIGPRLKHVELRDVIAREVDWFGSRLSVHLNGRKISRALHLDLGTPPKDRLLCHLNFGIFITTLNKTKQRGSIAYDSDPGLDTYKSTGSPAVLSQIEAWLESCQNGHPSCRSHLRGGGRPTRLIKLEDSGTMFSLNDDLREDVRYAAISYRWGSNKKAAMLTTSSLQTIRQKTPIHWLPKTLRDVCDVAYRLGFEYVWIDRLCIIQDSTEDWQKEASRMALVYTQASCTIAASCALDEDNGCLKERKVIGVVPLRLRSCPLLPGHDVFIQKQESLRDSPHDKYGYLAARGWIFQEWLLSTRVIHFAAEKVYWECRENEANETWPFVDEEQSKDLRTFSRPSMAKLSTDDLKSATTTWSRMVEEYSARKLTYETDKLLAISGLARAVHELADGNLGPYVAGLWQSDFTRWLGWMIPEEVFVRLPNKYIAPSWSWACLDAPVSFGYRFYLKNLIDLAELKKIRLTYVSDTDPYAAIQDGSIVLHGHMKLVHIEPAQDISITKSDSYPRKRRIVYPDLESKSLTFLTNATVIMDTITWSSNIASAPIYYLPLNMTDRQSPTVYGILLAPYGLLGHNRTPSSRPLSHTSKEFERVGFVMMFVPPEEEYGFEEWLSQSPKEDVTIR
ncbi:heterokaryon incompatibility protein-domain-containing protein [Annulohypoxylon bovei var. microspora]|nr:heterokaryon incompatibility protein-domain-containing protein [Annulohypoxylon bovei var. microspora]